MSTITAIRPAAMGHLAVDLDHGDGVHSTLIFVRGEWEGIDLKVGQEYPRSTITNHAAVELKQEESDASGALQVEGSGAEESGVSPHARDSVHSDDGSGGGEGAQGEALGKPIEEEDRREAAPEGEPQQDGSSAT